MSGGHLSSCICSHEVAPLASLLTPSTFRFRFFIETSQLPPNATKVSLRFLSISHRNCLEPLGRRAEFPSSLPALDVEKEETISYLTSMGLSEDAALRVSRFVGSKSREKVVAMIRMFRSYGFSYSQINEIATRRPRLLAFHLPKTLKPKLDFLLSEDFSRKEVAAIFTANHRFFERHLERGLIATYHYLSATLHSRSEVIRALKSHHQRVTVDDEPKLKILRDNGVSEAIIYHILKYFPSPLVRELEYLEEAVKTLLELGVDPKTKRFVHTLKVMIYISKEGWLRKLKLFQELGWSESEAIDMFMKHPCVFSLADEQLRRKVNFFKENFGWQQEFIRYAVLPQLSLERRIIPRTSILKLLMSKGLIKKEWSTHMFYKTEKWFLETYVKRYIDEVPGIVKMYEDAKAFKDTNACLNL